MIILDNPGTVTVLSGSISSYHQIFTAPYLLIKRLSPFLPDETWLLILINFTVTL